MIQYNPKSWFKLIFEFHKSDTFRTLIWVLVLIALYSGAVVFLEFKFRGNFQTTVEIHKLLGFVIGLLLVFRTNTAYERWWEGRKHWGALVNVSRSFSMKINAILSENDEENRMFFSAMIPNYVFSMKNHLRNTTKWDEFKETKGVSIEEMSKYVHLPNAIAAHIHEKVHSLYNNQVITGDQLIILDKELKSLTDIVGACERIKNTPIPFSYNIFIKKFIFVYVMTLPFGLVSIYEYWTIPITAFVFYVFGSMELLAEEIEDPFGTDSNDLPTDELSEKIAKNVDEIYS